MNKITCVETNRIKHPELLANVIFNNFFYLTNFPELQHTKKDIMDILSSNSKSKILCYLLYDDKKLIGYLIGDFRTFPDNRYGFYISYVFIAEKYRNQKLGSKLMNLLIEKCKKVSVKFIILTCDTNDKKIVNFYKKYGFKVDSSLGGNKRHDVFCLNL